MKLSSRMWISGLALAATLGAAPAATRAAAPKTYQVTGPILEVNDSSITVEKEKERWQIARDKDTKVTGDLKPGGKVTIQYRMTAASIEAKADKAADKDKDKDKAAKPAKPDKKK